MGILGGGALVGSLAKAETELWMGKFDGARTGALVMFGARKLERGLGGRLDRDLERELGGGEQETWAGEKLTGQKFLKVCALMSER